MTEQNIFHVFVFGSNRAGRHGKGSALEALKKHGAVYGRGEGFYGQSYAIATKDHFLKRLPLKVIEENVQTFLTFAKEHPELKFNVVAVGCGLAGFKPKQIAPMFKNYPANVHLPLSFFKILEG